MEILSRDAKDLIKKIKATVSVSQIDDAMIKIFALEYEMLCRQFCKKEGYDFEEEFSGSIKKIAALLKQKNAQSTKNASD